MVERLLRERPAGWFTDYDEMLLRALADGVEEARRMQGRDVSNWRYGDYLRVTINESRAARGAAGWASISISARCAMSGSGTTVKQTTPHAGAFDAHERGPGELGTFAAQPAHRAIGPGDLSKHYKDQWTDYLKARSYPMQFSKVNANSTLTFTPSSSPNGDATVRERALLKRTSGL